MLVAVDLVVKFKLQHFLTLLYEEIPNGFRDRIFNVSQNDFEVGVNSFSHLADENIATSLNWRTAGLVLLHLILTWSWLTIRVTALHLRLRLLLWDYICSVILVVLIIGEKIILLGVNNCLNNFSCMISFFTQNLNNDVHDLRDHGWESLKDLVHNTVSNLFEL